MKFSLLLLFFFAITASASARPLHQTEIDLIINHLKASGETNIKQAMSLLKSPKIDRSEESLEINVTKPIKLSMRKYSHFTEPYAMNLAMKFKRRWRTLLKKTQQKYRVDKEIIVAVLLVETSFGRFKGNHQILGVYSGLIADIISWKQSDLYQTTEEKSKARFLRKLTWATGELRALLEMNRRYPDWDLYQLRGSYAGAFGKAQFLPSSFLNFAQSYTGGQRPRLENTPDAIVSIANYLRENGFVRPMTSKKAKAALFHYNNSQVYVQTLINVAQKLKGNVSGPERQAVEKG
ncbi:MAG: lytic murein transglycosylase [Pseudobacteriovorax sp.]|nr:lytic murein transglycosylase [Pseudobacteriovorax sp.]